MRSRRPVTFLHAFFGGAMLCLLAGPAGAESDPSGSASRFFIQEQQRLRPPAHDPAPAPRHGLGSRPSVSLYRPAISRQYHPAASVASARKVPSLVVAVYGDRLGQALVRGLEDDAADWIAVAAATSEDAGLTRADFTDWLALLRTRVQKPDRPAVAVIMLGANDRQALADGGKMVEPGSERWQALYAARIDAVAAAFRDAHVPLIWVGLPTVRGVDVSADFVRLNAMFRDRAGKDAATFVDSWEAFSDDTGSYSPIGPDVDGRIVKLRKADGFGFTRAGALKLASFVEQDIKRLQTPHSSPDSEPQVAVITIEKGSDFDQALDIDVNAQIQREAALASGIPIATIKPAGPPPAPTAGPVLSLTSAPLAQDGILATASVPPSTMQAGLVVDPKESSGDAAAPKPGRADDFVWPKP